MTATKHPNAFDSILLIAFGGPPTGKEGYPFVKGIVGDRPANTLSACAPTRCVR